MVALLGGVGWGGIDGCFSLKSFLILKAIMIPAIASGTCLDFLGVFYRGNSRF